MGSGGLALQGQNQGTKREAHSTVIFCQNSAEDASFEMREVWRLQADSQS